MSWDAYLTDDRGHCEGDWNYTHNCNGMANALLCDGDIDEWVKRSAAWWERRDRSDVAQRDLLTKRFTWWAVLDDMSGPEGAAFLDRIIKGLEADPERFMALNPTNEWGNYDDFLKILIDMRDRVPEWPCVWSTSG